MTNCFLAGHSFYEDRAIKRAAIVLLVGIFLLPGQTAAQPRTWIALETPWVVTTYDQGLVGHKHGAAWHGLTCYDLNGRAIPDRVDNVTLAVAGPGTVFYCMPVEICYRQRCVVAIMVDVPKDYSLTGEDGRAYHHLDLWPAVARALDMKGMTWGEAAVKVGEKYR